MKKARYGFVVALAMMVVPLSAQETYRDTKLADNELNGTARYVGMGGALEALGADISTISSNPAGVGLFRSSQLSLSGGFVSQSDATTTPSFGGIKMRINGNKTNASFDQVGLVYVMRTSQQSFLNFAFNYHKSRNFDQILNAGGLLDKASQNKLTAMKYPYGCDYNWNGVDANYSTMLTPILNDQGKQVGLDYLNGTAYLFGQYQKGYIGEYDFNISGNLNDRVYLGLTVGLRDVNYRSNSYYTEDLEQSTTAESWEELRIDGTGFDIKAGVIFRPIESSPFRVGFYVHTPTWYDLSLSSANDVAMADAQGSSSSGQKADYDYKVFTPWKFGVSLGHTVANILALGATYEYTDYGAIDNRVNDGGYYDYWGSFYEESSSDNVMNSHTKATLKGVSTLKFGLEYKPMPEFSIRLGYNYVSPMFCKSGYRDGSLESLGTVYATSTDYTNWKSTNRITAGLGYQMKKFFVDLAYQYSRTNGEFYPFANYVADDATSSDNCIVDGVKVNNKRNQMLLTLGYRF